MRLFQIDSFTKEKYKGNPAGVCIVDQDLSEEQMQCIAMEMNLSETAFVRLYDKHCNLRWFTPASEVPLCGHATLATAFVLWSEGFRDETQALEFSTLSGALFTSLNRDGSISMDFPASVPGPDDSFDKTICEEEIGGLITEVLTVPNELILILKDDEKLLKADPDSKWVSNQSKNGVIISAKSSSDDFDFVSRYFAPNLGIKEDPVTGFMHTILTPYWSKKLNKNEFRAYQASARGGQMRTQLKGDRVILTGDAIKVFETDIQI